MSAAKVPYGKPVKLLIDFQGFPDGRLVQFEIWRKGLEEEKLSEVYGVTRAGKGIGTWNPQLEEREEVMPLKETVNQQVEEERYFFIAKIDDKEARSEDMVFVYPLDIYLENTNAQPVDGANYTITLSDGSKRNGVFKNGHAKLEKAPAGKFKLELEEHDFVFGIIVNARWEKNRTKCGEEVKMIVDVKGFEDETPAKFLIMEQDVNRKHDDIAEIEAKVQGNRVEATWSYSAEEVEEDLKEKEEEEKGEPEYFFHVKIKGEEAKSGILTFTHILDIYLEDEEGHPLDGVGYTITFSDGTQRKGKLIGGETTIEDAPYGRAIIEVEGYDLIIK